MTPDVRRRTVAVSDRDVDRRRLADRIRAERGMYEIVRADTAQRIAAHSADPATHADVSAFENACARAVLARGSADSAAFAPLVARAVAQVVVLDAAEEDRAAARLAVLNVVGDLQVMGLAVPDATVATARGWLAGMRTEAAEPESWHWQRGLAALALGDLRTARTIAAVPESGPTGVDPDAYPQFNVQGWFALFLAAALGEIDWPVLATRWEEFLLLVPVFEEIRVFALRDLPWPARVVHSGVAGHPVGSVADWLHGELSRVAGPEP
jgi:hypothetical protein